MKTARILVLATFLVAVAACSKQDNTGAVSQVPMAEMPAMEKPMEKNLQQCCPMRLMRAI